jgi:hypothetical protein
MQGQRGQHRHRTPRINGGSAVSFSRADGVTARRLARPCCQGWRARGCGAGA